jgi:hypothetical protein
MKSGAGMRPVLAGASASRPEILPGSIARVVVCHAMRLAISILLLLVVALGVFGSVLYFKYGTVAPCDILRERIRQQAVREGGQLGSFVATAIPDNILDGLIAAQYGPLSPGRCVSLVVHGVPEKALQVQQER